MINSEELNEFYREKYIEWFVLYNKKRKSSEDKTNQTQLDGLLSGLIELGQQHCVDVGFEEFCIHHVDDEADEDAECDCCDCYLERNYPEDAN